MVSGMDAWIRTLLNSIITYVIRTFSQEQDRRSSTVPSARLPAHDVPEAKSDSVTNTPGGAAEDDHSDHEDDTFDQDGNV